MNTVLYPNNLLPPFVARSGVPWALRQAACRARPIHQITHKGNRLTIKIEGVITTQTTYIIDGPAVEVDIRGRLFQDRVTYLENGKGVSGIKTALKEKYTIYVDRVLSEDKQTIVLTGRAEFKDGKDPIESKQVFHRIS